MNKRPMLLLFHYCPIRGACWMVCMGYPVIGCGGRPGGATLYPRCVCRSLPLGFQGAHFVLVSDDACPALRVLKYARLSTRERCKVHSLATLIADLGLTTTTTTTTSSTR